MVEQIVQEIRACRSVVELVAVMEEVLKYKVHGLITQNELLKISEEKNTMLKQFKNYTTGHNGC